jgi:probable rRNA maturation factor
MLPMAGKPTKKPTGKSTEKRKVKKPTSTLKPKAGVVLKAVLKKARAISALKRLAKAPHWEVSVVLVGEAFMTRLNSHYRDADYATDVLSFEAPSVFRKQGLLGELVICQAVLKRQAKEYGHSAATELEILIVHGVLHLLGFDHEKSPKQAREMEKWEGKLLGARIHDRGLIQRTHR